MLSHLTHLLLQAPASCSRSILLPLLLLAPLLALSSASLSTTMEELKSSLLEQEGLGELASLLTGREEQGGPRSGATSCSC